MQDGDLQSTLEFEAQLESRFGFSNLAAQTAMSIMGSQWSAIVNFETDGAAEESVQGLEPEPQPEPFGPMAACSSTAVLLPVNDSMAASNNNPSASPSPTGSGYSDITLRRGTED
jgi:hypothetical protein